MGRGWRHVGGEKRCAEVKMEGGNGLEKVRSDGMRLERRGRRVEGLN